jgi:acyl carrier protein
MSLDSVELVMEMEETFGIVFDDLDAEYIGTVGQAYRYILRKLELKAIIPCPSASIFYRLRLALMARSGADRRNIRPASRIEDFLPERGRREAWLALRDEVGMTMPRLEFGPGLTLATWLLGLMPILAVVAAWGTLGGFSTSLAASVLVSSLVLSFSSPITAYLALGRFAAKIPRGCETIRGTVESILGRRRLYCQGDVRTWQSDEVWFTLRELISEQLGVPRDQVTEEKDFVYDFGMD